MSKNMDQENLQTQKLEKQLKKYQYLLAATATLSLALIGSNLYDSMYRDQDKENPKPTIELSPVQSNNEVFYRAQNEIFDDMSLRMQDMFDQLRAVETMQRHFFRPDYLSNRYYFSNSVRSSISDTEYLITAQLPGFDKDDIKVEFTEEAGYDVLSIKAKKVSEKNEKNSEETSSSSFQQTIRVPKDIDKSGIKSNIKNGILTVSMPRIKPNKEATKEIDIE